MTVHVLYENEAWLPPLVDALRRQGLEPRPVFVDGGVLDVSQAPEPGVYVNRMSPSAHTRGHQGGVAFLNDLLPWLEASGRRVLNGSRAFALEVSKLRQDVTLRAAGIRTPRTVGVVGSQRLVEAAASFDGPFLTKHNQGGKGLGVQLFRELGAFERHVATGDFLPSPDGVTVLQEFVEPPEPFVTRVEIVDGRFLYALRSNTAGGFLLCPSDACQVADGEFCPVGPSEKFTPRTDLTADDPLVRSYVAYCQQHGLDVAGIEFVEDADGNRYTYDVNANSNYNSSVEARVGVHGMDAIAQLCARELERTAHDSAAPLAAK